MAGDVSLVMVIIVGIVIDKRGCIAAIGTLGRVEELFECEAGCEEEDDSFRELVAYASR